jgi:hypothetical protein
MLERYAELERVLEAATTFLEELDCSVLLAGATVKRLAWGVPPLSC